MSKLGLSKQLIIKKLVVNKYDPLLM